MLFTFNVVFIEASFDLSSRGCCSTLRLTQLTIILFNSISMIEGHSNSCSILLTQTPSYFSVPPLWHAYPQDIYTPTHILTSSAHFVLWTNSVFHINSTEFWWKMSKNSYSQKIYFSFVRITLNFLQELL